ncbi:amylo-alpha-1,6-glucosidase [Xylophilus sp.]|uniref:amylo-alpha-1,6-glucosidase n=1 Tax=Xylophilus sp. TaxID=2653893 RepID=UPI0013B7DD51|nr:amylo-alpha-1,6-glucosidase [Xylophilus sp.]KAF1047655.1 MAG: hypothetical protein GAK38_01816 [Xylophilus sp.]
MATTDATTPPELPAGAAPERAVQSSFVLKDGDTYLVMDAHGDVTGAADGLFREDTRVLSAFGLRVDGARPSLLSSAVSHDNVVFTADLTNQPLPVLGSDATPHGVIHIERKRFLWEARLFERIRLANYGDRPARVPLALRFDADFRDMFEVRGQRRSRRGTAAAPRVHERTVELAYRGLDGVERRSCIALSQAPQRLDAHEARFEVELPARGHWLLYVEVGPDAAGAAAMGAERFRAAAARARRGMRAKRRRGARLAASGRLFQGWLDRSRADLALLTTDLPTGPYPYAGIPWFSTPFGRDAIVTALQVLWLDPGLARGVLSFLAARQAQETSSFRDAEPGKIMHETRKGEMAAVDELPFGQYYGGVDTTPLFVLLAGAYARRTGDRATVDALWPALEAAASWLVRSMERHPAGLLAYQRGEASGLANQGWKDSHDAIFHADGRTPEGPIALVEVQGYAWRALRAMADLARWRGEADAAAVWGAAAERLRTAVERLFWLDALQFYALAVDGAGQPCRVRASNAGHLLYSGLPAPERARAVARQLAGRAFQSGWGIRTLPSEAARFNPMSYHNGSVWPHDVALCGAGLARYGERDGVVQLLGHLFEAAVHFGMRLPELFCGFTRQPGEPPIAYPVACLPQAWAAGAPFMLLQSCLGLRVDGVRGTVHIVRPALPQGIDRLDVEGLQVGARRIGLQFRRVGRQVVVGCRQPEDDGPPVEVSVRL